MGWMAEESTFESQYVKIFSPVHIIQTGSGAHPAFYPLGTRGKAAGS
jgi:hypothetical protein